MMVLQIMKEEIFGEGKKWVGLSQIEIYLSLAGMAVSSAHG